MGIQSIPSVRHWPVELPLAQFSKLRGGSATFGLQRLAQKMPRLNVTKSIRSRVLTHRLQGIPHCIDWIQQAASHFADCSQGVVFQI